VKGDSNTINIKKEKEGKKGKKKEMKNRK